MVRELPGQLNLFSEWEDVELVPETVQKMPLASDVRVVTRLQEDALEQVRDFAFMVERRTDAGEWIEVYKLDICHEQLHEHLNGERIWHRPIDSHHAVQAAYTEAQRMLWARVSALLEEVSA